jgi:hypothetical protein
MPFIPDLLYNVELSITRSLPNDALLHATVEYPPFHTCPVVQRRVPQCKLQYGTLELSERHCYHAAMNIRVVARGTKASHVNAPHLSHHPCACGVRKSPRRTSRSCPPFHGYHPNWPPARVDRLMLCSTP